MESRELLSAGAGTGGGSSGGGQGGGTLPSIPNITESTAAPATLHEIARRAFTSRFSGPVLIGPPRTVDQANQFRIRGNGQSNYFLHDTTDMVLFTPASPTGQITGTASLTDRNINDGAVILLNFQGDPHAVDRQGRPTHLNFTVNGGGGSGGIFASSTGQGTVDIRYHGRIAFVTFKGQINTSGVGNPLLSITAKGFPFR